MATVSTGQITIVDLHDAPGLNAWISASSTTVQTYNNQTKTYSPNYASTAQVLTLNLTKAGGAGASLIGPAVTGVKWTKIVGNAGTEITSTTNTDTDYKSGPSNSVLTTKTNVPTDYNAIIWQVEGIYNDPDTGLPINFSASIDLKLVQLAKSAVVALAMTPNGDFFRNGTPSSLRITADIYKDGSVSSGSRKFKWFAADSSVLTSQDPDAGIGWRKITATSGTTGAVANTGFDVATTLQGVLTVYPDAVSNGQVFLMIATDNDGGTSGTSTRHSAHTDSTHAHRRRAGDDTNHIGSNQSMVARRAHTGKRITDATGRSNCRWHSIRPWSGFAVHNPSLCDFSGDVLRAMEADRRRARSAGRRADNPCQIA